jgi:Protein of unknown function (DUF2971)
MEKTPQYLYKYRAITNKDNWKEDYTLDALFNSYAIFSSRRNFNDLFDSKIEFIKPTVQQLKLICNKGRVANYLDLDRLIQNGKITPNGEEFFKKLIDAFEKILDSYAFYCVSAKNSNELMWAHYADSHQGFCIEFNFEKLCAEEVTYQETIPKIEIAELLAASHGHIDPNLLAKKLWQALRVKLEKWSYEAEYRCQTSDPSIENAIRNGAPYAKVFYENDFISSIIFGCRMPKERKEYIKGHMKYPVKFKQAVARKSSIEIIDCT